MLIKIITATETTDSAGKPIDSLPVRAADTTETDSAGKPVAIVAATEDAAGFPVRVIDGKVTTNSAGQPVDALPMSGLPESDE